MSRYSILLVFLFLVNHIGMAQTVQLFHENFNLPSGADSVSNGSVPQSSSKIWQTDTSTALGSDQFYHIKGEQGITNYFQTNVIDITGQAFIRIRFRHISKQNSPNSGELVYSLDNGVNWSHPLQSYYFGNANSHASFSDNSYPEWQPGLFLNPDSSWWKNEHYIIPNSSNDTKLIIRFRNFTSQQAQGPVPYMAGWFVDDINVEGLSCEPFAPDLQLDEVHLCTNPTGPVLIGSTQNHRVSVIADDQSLTSLSSGIDSVTLFWSVNKGAFSSLNLVSNSNNRYYNYIPAITITDTVRWYVKAWDNCSSETVLPKSPLNYFNFWLSDTNRCVLQSCNLLNIISSFPYTEDFEGPQWVEGFNGNRGSFSPNKPVKWAINPSLAGSSWGWGIQSSSHSSEFGPAKDHSETGTGKYLFAATNLQQVNQSTSFTSPCIDLTDSLPKLMSFFYHAFGEDTGELKVHIDTGRTSSSYWSGYLKIIGEQNESSISPWKKAYIDLSPFSGKIIKVLINYVKKNAGSNQGWALDDFSIENLPGTDIALTSIISPKSNVFGNTASTMVQVTVQNLGEQTLSQIPIAYLNGTIIVRDTVFPSSPLKTMSLDTVAFTTPLSLTSHNTWLKIWTELATDQNNQNDTLVVNIPPYLPVINSFPLFIDFENSSTASNSNNGLLNHSGFFLFLLSTILMEPIGR